MLAQILPLLALLSPAFAALSKRDLAALLERPTLKEYSPAPPGWIVDGPAPEDYMLSLQIGLRQSNMDLLTQHLLEISDPTHPRYSQHLSKSQVDELVSPSTTTLDLVHAWLRSHDVDPIKHNTAPHESKDWITVELPVEKVEVMLGTSYSTWLHQETGTRIVRTEKWGVPEVLANHIDVVQPTNKFLTLHSLRAPNQILSTLNFDPVLPLGLSSPADLSSSIKGLIPDQSGRLHSIYPSTAQSQSKIQNSSAKQASAQSVQAGAKNSKKTTSSCDDTMTAGCLRDLYNFGAWNATVKSKSTLAVASYLNQYANMADLKTYVKNQRPEANGVSVKVTLVNGGKNLQAAEKAGTEANLDVQYGVGMAWPVPVTTYSVGGKAEEFQPDAAEPTNGNEPFQASVNYFLNLSDSALPKVISTSYGDDEQTVPFSYANRVCTSFAQLGARGVSLLFASGDGGVGGLAGDNASQCISNDGRKKKQFLPTFPASCPWVTSVGSTVGVKEKATTRFGSGAGFSNYFKQPSYQKTAVKKYLNGSTSALYPGMWNKTGRASPDVSASGDNFMIWVGGNPMLIGGTSASTPVFAAAIAVLNDYRLTKGKATLGFLNPWLYANGTKFLNDITSGSSFGCGTKGFPAASGWDAVTGLGTPNIGRMIKYLPA